MARGCGVCSLVGRARRRVGHLLVLILGDRSTVQLSKHRRTRYSKPRTSGPLLPQLRLHLLVFLTCGHPRLMPIQLRGVGTFLAHRLVRLGQPRQPRKTMPSETCGVILSNFFEYSVRNASICGGVLSIWTDVLELYFIFPLLVHVSITFLFFRPCIVVGGLASNLDERSWIKPDHVTLQFGSLDEYKSLVGATKHLWNGHKQRKLSKEVTRQSDVYNNWNDFALKEMTTMNNDFGGSYCPI